MVFSFLSFFLLFFGICVVKNRNPVYSVFFLILVFLLSAILLFFLEVEFISFLFILVYIGAIAILFLFVVMMLDIKYTKRKLQTKYNFLSYAFQRSFLKLYFVLFFFF